MYLNVLYSGTKYGNAYAIACLLLTHALVLLTRISCLTMSYAELTLAYAPHSLNCLRHILTRGPFLNMNTRV